MTTVDLEHAVHQLEHQAREIAVLLVRRELDQLAVADGDVVADRSPFESSWKLSALAVLRMADWTRAGLS